MSLDLIDITMLGRHIVLPAYTSFIVLGGLAAIVIGAITATRRGLPSRSVIICLFLGLSSMLIGARLLHRIANPSFYAGHPELGYTLSRIGLSVYGGLILAMVVVPVACKVLRMNLWRFADSITPALGIGIAVARVGCFLNGCCCGVPTSLPWGVVYPSGSPAFMDQLSRQKIGLFDSPLPVHPTQPYEVVVALLCAILAVWLMRRKSPDGMAFASFALAFTAFRWLNFYLLAHRNSSDPAIWLYPALYALIILVSTVSINHLQKQRSQ